MAAPRDENQVPQVGVAAQGYITPASSNAASTTGGSDYSFTWTQPVFYISICNKCGANVYYEHDAPANLGSPVVPSTYGQTVFLNVQTTTLHIYTAANQNINGTADNNVSIRGWR